MTRWPWISLTLSALVVASPYGVDLIHTAFWAGEALARSLSQLVLGGAIGIMLLVIAVEFLIRRWLLRKR